MPRQYQDRILHILFWNHFLQGLEPAFDPGLLVCIFRRTEGRNGIGLSFCTLSGIRYHTVVFLPRCIKRWNQCPDRIQLSCEEGCIQDQHPSHRKNHLRTFRACFFCGLCTALMCMLRIYTKPLYTADHLLLCLHFPFCTGTCVCYKCDRHFFPWSGPDHRYFSSGGCMAYTDHVGYRHAFFTSMADQAV